jgi:hypothetical protein
MGLLRSARTRSIFAVCWFCLAVTACTSAPDAALDDWSRTYVADQDRVFEALLDALEDSGFLVEEVDRGRGRVAARASTRRGGDTSLIVRVQQKVDRVRVDVMAGDPGAADGLGSRSMAPAVSEVLRELDARLEGRVN